MAGASLLGKDHPIIHPFASRIEKWRHRRSKSEVQLTEKLTDQFSE
jgi:hypothetical protein